MSNKGAMDECLCSRSNFPEEIDLGSGKGGGRKGAAVPKKTLAFGGQAFAKRAHETGGGEDALETKKEDSDNIWFFNVPPSKLCMHLLR